VFQALIQTQKNRFAAVVMHINDNPHGYNDL